MAIVKGYTKQVNSGRREFISEDEYNKLMAEYIKTCDDNWIVDETENFCITGFRFDKDRNVVRLGWAYYPQF